MDDPRDGSDAGAFGDGIAGKFVVFDGQARDSPSGRIEAQGFGEDVAGVGELREVVESRSASLKDGVEFGVEFFFDARVLREEPPCPGESAGGGFVAGKEESEGFIAELLIGHAGAVVVLSVKKHGEEVPCIFVGLAALLDDAIDDCVELANGAIGIAIHFGGEPLGSDHEAAKVGGVFEEDVEGFADLRGVAFDVGAEERFANDLEGEAHHGVVEVDGLVRLPGFEEVCGAGGHGGGIVGDARTVKCRLHHAALTEPEVALAGKEAIAENVSIGAKDAALDEFVRVVDDDVFNVVRVKQEEGADVEEAKTDDVAVVAKDALHEGKGIAADGAAEAVEKTRFGTGGIFAH